MVYQSRLHATNGLISLAVDALSGELLELTLERTADNLLKSHQYAAPTPFRLELYEGDACKTAWPARYAEIRLRDDLRPTIDVDQREGSAVVRTRYPAVVGDDGAVYPVAVEVEIELPAGECRTLWRMRLAHEAADVEVQRALFPYLSGLWLGDTWTDDTLVMPLHAGEKVPNPVETLASAPQAVEWKWQEYRYVYPLGGPYGVADARGAYVHELPYSGAGSMLWLDVYDEGEDAGLYLTCRNTELVMKAIRAETFGPSRPGLGVSVVHYPCLRAGEWASEDCVVALHEGDWHWAADDYRAFRESIPSPALAKRHRPKWYEESPGLVAHYDFQYQGGGIVHRYRDIPALLDKARALGMNHLLLSGWNEDGFDNGFPQYRFNPNLGTEQELIDAVHQVRKAGGHVAFYINARLCNTRFEDRQALIQESALMRRDGQLHIERYGAADLSFASMCNQDKRWRDEFVGVVDYLTHTVGADSMYLDQLAMASSIPCYHPGHTEHAGNPAGWNQGYQKMLEGMRGGYDEDGMALIYEGCSDVYGPGVSGQLISTMFWMNSGACPEVYKYTFPDQILVDMMNPRRNTGMRAEHVARKSTFLLYRAFVVGSYLWVYDLEWDNTFDRDPEQAQRLREQNALRSAWLKAYGHGRFVDTIGLRGVPEGLLVKRYELEDGVLIAYANEKRLPGEWLVRWTKAEAPRAVVRTMSAPDAEAPASAPLRTVDGATYAVLTAPEDELAVFVLR